MKRLLIQSCLALLCAAVFASGATAGRRAKYNFNSGWKLFVGDPVGAEAPGFDDSAWKDVTLPRAWNEDDAFRVDIKDLSTGVAWYRKHFKLPPNSAGVKVFVEFEGVRQAGEVYLNGKFVGRSENGVMAFGFDATDLLKPAPEENVVAVRTDNSWDYKERGTGSAFQWNDRNFYANYGGVNRVIIRTTTKPGLITLSASAEGLQPATRSVESHAVEVTDGLSRELPGEGIPPYLERGPTPAGPSFKVTRRPVKVARASAGANAEKASASFDDDETTEWKSDGKIENGWVRYDFERPAKVGEVTLKLAGWRTQSYPVRILVDDKVAYSGRTPRSLGYVTFTFPPVVGRSLRVELMGSASNRDAFGNIIEIPGTPDPQSNAGRGGAKSTLSIIEIEIYEPVGGN
jgi:hypothetical protein